AGSPSGPALAVAQAALFGLVFGVAAAGQTANLLAAIQQVPFGVVEPAFGRDAGFYVFTLPPLRALVTWALPLCLLRLIATAGGYYLAFQLQRERQRRERAWLAEEPLPLRYSRRALDDIPERPAPALTIGAPFGTLAHFGAGFFLALAARFWLNTVELV